MSDVYFLNILKLIFLFTPFEKLYVHFVFKT